MYLHVTDQDHEKRKYYYSFLIEPKTKIVMKKAQCSFSMSGFKLPFYLLIGSWIIIGYVFGLKDRSIRSGLHLLRLMLKKSACRKHFCNKRCTDNLCKNVCPMSWR
jgi:hypothetical protein